MEDSGFDSEDIKLFERDEATLNLKTSVGNMSKVLLNSRPGGQDSSGFVMYDPNNLSFLCKICMFTS